MLTKCPWRVPENWLLKFVADNAAEKCGFDSNLARPEKFVIVNRMRVRPRVCVRARERLDCSHGIFDIEFEI